MAFVKNQWNFFSQSAMFIATGCSSVWWSTAFGTLGPLVQVQSSRFFNFRGLRRPLNEPSPLSLPLAPKNGLVPPKVFLICFCFFWMLPITRHRSRFSISGACACHPHGWSLLLVPRIRLTIASLGRPFTQEIMGSLGRKIHSELLYGLTNHRLPITTSLVHRPIHAYEGRLSLLF
jgi:hypothetical protein